MLELNPCPFCGSDHIIWSLGKGMNHGVMCAECGAGFGAFHKTKEEVARKWNRRVKEE